MSTVSRIRFKKFVLRIKLLDPGADVREREGLQRSGNAEQFRTKWHELQRAYAAPVVPWLPRDTAIVRNLLGKRSLDSLEKLGVEFWRRRARDMGVFDGNDDQIILFAAAIKAEIL